MTAAFNKPLTKNMRTDGAAVSLQDFERTGGYQAVRKVLNGMAPKQVTEEVKKS